MYQKNQQGKLSPALAILIILLIVLTALLAWVAGNQKKSLKSSSRAATELNIPGLGPKLVSRTVRIRLENVANLTGFGVNVELKSGIPKESVKDIHVSPMTGWFPAGEELSEPISGGKTSYIRTIQPPGVSGAGEVVQISYTAAENLTTNPFELKGASLVFGEGVNDYLQNFQCPTTAKEEASNLTISGPGVPCQ